MRPRNKFLLGLIAVVIVFFSYGLKRFALGVDFTDEGEYLTWPMAGYFGERPFEREIMTLIKPIGLFLSPLLDLRPSMTLYEFRLLGWSVHLAAFSVFASYLFVRSGAPMRSLLIASAPVFISHIFGLATPSYNSLSSDFLLLTLSLTGLLSVEPANFKVPLSLAAGGCLFVATLAYPPLGLVAIGFILRECIQHRLVSNLFTRHVTPSNMVVVAFVGSWTAVLLYLAATGSLRDWLGRIPLTRSFAASALAEQPLNFFYRLFRYAFAHSWLSACLTLTILLALVLARLNSKGRGDPGKNSPAGYLGVLLVGYLIATLGYEPDFLTPSFAQVSLVLVGLVYFGHIFIRTTPVAREIVFLVSMSALGAILCATFTYYFSPHRSWVSGILALPFAFGVGLNLLLSSASARPRMFEAIIVLSLVLLTVCAAGYHYRSIFRDAAPGQLSAEFRTPKLQKIRSTDERVYAVDALFEYLHPRITPGERMLAYDSCPILYFVFDTLPAYGWAGAKRYNLTEGALVRLDREMNKQTLPRYAVRALVDVSNSVWSTAPRLNYDNYPLNETVMANYVLERTIFPFEIWRLKSVPTPQTE